MIEIQIPASGFSTISVLPNSFSGEEVCVCVSDHQNVFFHFSFFSSQLHHFSFCGLTEVLILSAEVVLLFYFFSLFFLFENKFDSKERERFPC